MATSRMTSIMATTSMNTHGSSIMATYMKPYVI